MLANAVRLGNLQGVRRNTLIAVSLLPPLSLSSLCSAFFSLFATSCSLVTFFNLFAARARNIWFVTFADVLPFFIIRIVVCMPCCLVCTYMYACVMVAVVMLR